MDHDVAQVAVQEAHELVDTAMKKAVGAAYRSGYLVACGKKCFACCSEAAVVGKPEAELLVDRLSALPAEVQTAVRSRAARWMDAFEASGLASIKAVDVHRYRAAKLECPFLKDGLCAAYQSRPMACRGHVAVGERAQCEDDSLRKDQRYVLVDNLMAAGFLRMARDQDVEFDHLGVWLGELLLGRRAPSADRFLLSMPEKP